MERIYLYIILYSVLITAVAVPVIVDYLMNRAATPEKFMEKARKVLYENGFNYSMDEGVLTVTYRGAKYQVYFFQNDFSKSCTVCICSYWDVPDAYDDVNTDGLRIMIDHTLYLTNLRLNVSLLGVDSRSMRFMYQVELAQPSRIIDVFKSMSAEMDHFSSAMSDDLIVIRQVPKYQSGSTSSANHKTVGFKAGYHSDGLQYQDAAVAETETDVKG